MNTFLLITVIVLIVVVIGILLYLWWLPVKIKKMIRQNDEDNAAISIEEANFDEEEKSNE